jgi:hypothetical protein
MKEMQANRVQQIVMINTVRIFFRKPVFFVISKPQASGYETGECIQFKLYSLNIFFRSAVLRSNCDRHWIKIIVNAVVGQATNNNVVVSHRLGCVPNKNRLATVRSLSRLFGMSTHRK